jgi:ubiquinone/menaquinone biosynthesis C-methylase UbiE
VLCSVRDPQQVLNEALRVLKPGGKFYFIEHVAAPQQTWLRRCQRVMRPIWIGIADGCRPDRETGAAIQNAGFRSVELEGFRVPFPPALPFVSPHVAGVAVK